MSSPIEIPLLSESVSSFLCDGVKNTIGNIVVYNTIDSTNLEAKRLLSKEERPLSDMLLLAEHQSAGRGRLGRRFFSPQNTGIYMSLIHFDTENKNVSNSVAITVTAAVAVLRALKSFGVKTKIKWVNDLYIGKKKVCGILTEGVLSSSKVDAYIIGIGINVMSSADDFPNEIKKIAGSINKNIDRNELAASVLNNLYTCFETDPSVLMDEYRKNSNVLNEFVTVIKPNESFSARVLTITDEAHLIVQKQDGNTEELLSGEISLRI